MSLEIRWLLLISYCSHLGGHGITIGVIHGSRGATLSAIEPCRMDVTLSMALDISRSLHQTILYLLRSK